MKFTLKGKKYRWDFKKCLKNLGAWVLIAILVNIPAYLFFLG